MKSVIKAFLEDSFLFEFDSKVTDGSDLFSEGFMDSFGFVELITFLEEEFSVKFESNELTGKKFCSVDAILATLEQKGVSTVDTGD